MRFRNIGNPDLQSWIFNFATSILDPRGDPSKIFESVENARRPLEDSKRSDFQKRRETG
jgi:hypothetical protein